jgi:hypothetical protein
MRFGRNAQDGGAVHRNGARRFTVTDVLSICIKRGAMRFHPLAS